MRTTFKMENEYITMIRGDTLSFGVIVNDENGNPIDFDLDNVKMTCQSQNINNNNILFQKTLGDGITKKSQGTYVIRVAPQDTENEELGKYFYDIQIEKNGDVFTIMHGILELQYEVTRGVNKNVR